MDILNKALKAELEPAVNDIVGLLTGSELSANTREVLEAVHLLLVSVSK